VVDLLLGVSAASAFEPGQRLRQSWRGRARHRPAGFPRRFPGIGRQTIRLRNFTCMAWACAHHRRPVESATPRRSIVTHERWSTSHQVDQHNTIPARLSALAYARW